MTNLVEATAAGPMNVMPDSLLDVRTLSIFARGDREERTLVRELSFTVGAGETLGIVGESGSGKSLTARALVGLLPEGVRATGAAGFRGEELIGAGERVLRRVRGREVSLVLQDPFTMLNPLQTAGATIAESLSRDTRRDRKAVRAEVHRRLAEVGVEAAAAKRYPFQLSGGMRQRVALAAALGRDPALLIADEPTTALDVTTQAEVLALLKDLQRRRRMSIVLITHDLGVAFTVCDRVLVVYAGSALESGPAAEVAERPGHPYTLGLRLADPPVTHLVERLNSIPGRVPDADDVADCCPFADRCEWVQPRCRAGYTPLRSLTTTRASACIRIDEIGAELAARLHGRQRSGASVEPVKAGAVVSVRGLSKQYGNVARALDGVSFDIMSGESLGLVGESGSGKTTIARCMLGLETGDAGSIELFGIEVADYRRLTRADLKRVRAGVQVVFQDPYSSLNPRLRVGASLREAAAVRGGEAEVAELLDLVGLPSAYARRRPADLSGGERQRVAIARALAVRPRLLVCDEPSAALDVSVQAQILELLRDVRARWEMSMLFITHDLAVVRQMTDRVIVLKSGSVVEAGVTADVLDRPQHPYTQKLLASVLEPAAEGG